MKTILLAAVTTAFSPLTCADVPPGPDAINGSFMRMLEHEASVAVMSAASGDAREFHFERWFNAVVRGDTSPLEAGFANLAARADDAPLVPDFTCD